MYEHVQTAGNVSLLAHSKKYSRGEFLHVHISSVGQWLEQGTKTQHSDLLPALSLTQCVIP